MLILTSLSSLEEDTIKHTCDLLEVKDFRNLDLKRIKYG